MEGIASAFLHIDILTEGEPSGKFGLFLQYLVPGGPGCRGGEEL